MELCHNFNKRLLANPRRLGRQTDFSTFYHDMECVRLKTGLFYILSRYGMCPVENRTFLYSITIWNVSGWKPDFSIFYHDMECVRLETGLFYILSRYEMCPVENRTNFFYRQYTIFCMFRDK